MRLARERPGAGFAGLLVPDTAVPVGIVLAVFEQRAIRLESLAPGLAARGDGVTFPRTGRADRGAGHARGGGLHRDRLLGRPGRRGDRQRTTATVQDRLLGRGTLHRRVIQLRLGYGIREGRLGFLQLGHLAVRDFHGRFRGRGRGRREVRSSGRMTTLCGETERCVFTSFTPASKYEWNMYT